MAGSENKVQRCYLGSFETGSEIVKKELRPGLRIKVQRAYNDSSGGLFRKFYDRF